MAALCSLFETLGCTSVRTCIQSGNVIFTSPAQPATEHLEAAIAGAFGIDTTVLVRTPTALERVVRANPFPHTDVSKLHVGFMKHKPPASAVANLDADRFLPEEFMVRATELYLHLPNGVARTRLLAYLGGQLNVPTTVRTWNTVTKLVDLAHG